jgi:hypothetical protein
MTDPFDFLEGTCNLLWLSVIKKRNRLFPESCGWHMEMWSMILQKVVTYRQDNRKDIIC